MLITIIIVIVVVALIFATISAYNSLSQAKIHIDEAESQIDVQLKRRNDLIPNLVNTVKGYKDFEQETLEKIAGLRSRVAQAATPNEKLAASDELSKGVQNIMITAEAYPELKANENFAKLQEELTNTENKITYARQLYNSCVTVFNTKCKTFPSNIFASTFGFTEKEYLSTPESEKAVPKVEF